MPALAPSSLDSKVLAARLAELTGEGRNIEVEFLLHLDEYDRRRAYLEAGYGSLWIYCTEALHLREGPTGRRIHAMRVLRRFPSLESALRDGTLCLTTIGLLGQVLTPENLDDLVARAAFKSKAEVDRLVASLQPRPAPKDGVRKLPEPRSESIAAVSPPPLREPSDVITPGTDLLSSTRREDASPATAIHVQACSAPALVLATPALPAPRSSRPELRPVSGSEWSLRVTLDDARKADLDTLRDLLSHKFPDGDLASVLHEAIRCAIEKHGKRRGAVPPSRTWSRTPATVGARDARAERASRDSASMTPPPAPVAPDALALFSPDPAPRSRPTATVRREVYARDGGSCAWVGENGRRCGSRWQLEHDHVQSASLGGGAEADEIRMLCRPHNMLHAEQVFGRGFMEQFRQQHFPEPAHGSERRGGAARVSEAGDPVADPRSLAAAFGGVGRCP
jgi:hypothetical protein